MVSRIARLRLRPVGSSDVSPVIRATTSAHDHSRKINRKTTKTFSLSGDAVFVSGSPDESEVVASLVSPSGKHLAVLRETNEAPDKKRYVEVWAGDRLHAVENVTDKHAAFYTDGQRHDAREGLALTLSYTRVHVLYLVLTLGDKTGLCR